MREEGIGRGDPSQPRGWPATVLEVGWLSAAVIVPFVFNPWGYDAFELPKTALLQALGLLMSLAALTQAISRWRRAGNLRLCWPATPTTLPALILGAVYISATALSVNPRVSLWGSYERQQGLLTCATYLVLFLLTATSLCTYRQVKRLWRALVWGSAPVVAYGLVQAAGLDPLDWQTDGDSVVL